LSCVIKVILLLLLLLFVLLLLSPFSETAPFKNLPKITEISRRKKTTVQ